MLDFALNFVTVYCVITSELPLRVVSNEIFENRKWDLITLIQSVAFNKWAGIKNFVQPLANENIRSDHKTSMY